MATVFQCLPWPTRQQIDKHMPPSFKRFYPKTRCIIDCTDFFIERPTTPLTQVVTYSTYKSHNTYKCLLGISPDGAFTFVSKLWGGNVSDRFITINSGFLDLVEPGDTIMADRGFTIQDLLLERRSRLVIPAFTRKCNSGKRKRLNVEEVLSTRRIARLRIHVERAIERLKNFELLFGILPMTTKSLANHIVLFVISCHPM